MKKVLLHIAAILGAAALYICALSLFPPLRTPLNWGKSQAWIVAMIRSAAYLLAFGWYAFAVRGLQKLECRGLWLYGLLYLVAVGYLFAELFFLNSSALSTASLLLMPLLAFLLLPILLLPLLKGQEGRWVQIVLLAALILALGGMIFGYYKGIPGAFRHEEASSQTHEPPVAFSHMDKET